MTKIKLCGLSRACDIAVANRLRPEYVGFVFAKKSKRYVAPELAEALKRQLDLRIAAVGVFVNEPIASVAVLLQQGIIDLAQLHGDEDEAYLRALREQTDRPIIQAFRIRGEADLAAAARSSAEYILLDSGAGTGTVFDWSLMAQFDRPYFLAGGLDTANVREAVTRLRPYAVDVSSGIETDGRKDADKMSDFVTIVRKEDKL